MVPDNKWYHWLSPLRGAPRVLNGLWPDVATSTARTASLGLSLEQREQLAEETADFAFEWGRAFIKEAREKARERAAAQRSRLLREEAGEEELAGACHEAEKKEIMPRETVSAVALSARIRTTCAARSTRLVPVPWLRLTRSD